MNGIAALCPGHILISNTLMRGYIHILNIYPARAMDIAPATLLSRLLAKGRLRQPRPPPPPPPPPPPAISA